MAETNLANTDKSTTGKPDTYILGIFITLCIVSIIEAYSASSREVAMTGSIFSPILRHIVLLTIGVAIMIIVSRINYIRMIFPSMVLSVGAVVVLALTLFLGNTINDAQRSISIFGIPVHASELAKIAVVFTLSYILALFIDKREGTVKDKGLYWCAGIVTMFGGLLLMQGMTNTILFMAISFALLIIGGTKTSKLVKIVGVYLLVGLAFLMIKGWIESRSLADLKEEDKQTQVEEKGALRNDTWSARIDRYAERFYGPPLYKLPIVTAGEDKNDQEMYSYMAQANGGIIGKIPGNSRETSRLPLANTDYVFSIIVEDTGLVGGVFLILLYFGLLIRAGNIARKCSRAYPAFLVMGMAVMVSLQAYFHMAITTGVFPVSGQPLPLISKGGTSIWITCLAFGVMLSVSRSAVQTNVAKEINKEKEALPEMMRAANPTKQEFE